MSRKALLIGINYIGSANALNGCVNDILNMKNFLTTEFNMKDEDIIMLNEANPALVPTRANIIKYINWLTADATANSRLFFHYSGHGTNIADNNGDENDRRDECIVPVDYDKNGLIVDDELRLHLVDVLPEGCQLFTIFDCCHSGTMFDLKYNYLLKPTDDFNTYQIILEKRCQDTKCNVTMLSGCLDDQTSADAYINRKPQGAMTYSFLAAYKRLRAAGKRLTCQNLMKLLHLYIKEGEYTQFPKLSTGKLINLNSPISFM